MPRPITSDDLRLALVDAMTRDGDERRKALRDVRHCVTVLPAAEVAEVAAAMLAGTAAYSLTILNREGAAVDKHVDRAADKLLATLAAEYPHHALTDHCAACLAALEIVFPTVEPAELAIRIAAAAIAHSDEPAVRRQYDTDDPPAVGALVEHYVDGDIGVVRCVTGDGRWRGVLVSWRTGYETTCFADELWSVVGPDQSREDAAGEGSS